MEINFIYWLTCINFIVFGYINDEIILKTDKFYKYIMFVKYKLTLQLIQLRVTRKCIHTQVWTLKMHITSLKSYRFLMSLRSIEYGSLEFKEMKGP